MNLIAVDPGRHTGVAWGGKEWVRVGHCDADVHTVGGLNGLSALIDKGVFAFDYQCYVIIEKPVPMKGSIAYGNLSQIVGAVKSFCDDYRVDWCEVAPSTWKARLRHLGEGPKKAKPREYVAHWLRVIREQLPIPAVPPTTVDEVDAVLIWWVWSSMQKEGMQDESGSGEV